MVAMHVKHLLLVRNIRLQCKPSGNIPKLCLLCSNSLMCFHSIVGHSLEDMCLTKVTQYESLVRNVHRLVSGWQMHLKYTCYWSVYSHYIAQCHHILKVYCCQPAPVFKNSIVLEKYSSVGSCIIYLCLSVTLKVSPWIKALLFLCL